MVMQTRQRETGENLNEELKRRTSSGEPNLMIFRGQIVPKNEAAHHRWKVPTRSPLNKSEMEN